MKRMNSVLVATLLASSFLMNNCQLKPSIGDCIHPPVTWEYPVQNTITLGTIVESISEIPPSGSWKLESILPLVPSGQAIIKSLVFHPPNEIWILMYKKLFRYRIDSRSWDEFNTINGLNTTPSRLFVSKDGTLWGVDHSVYGEPKNAERIPFLSRFDEVTGQFVFVSDQDQILTSNLDIIDITESVTNQNEEIWMLVVENLEQDILYKLISFDSKSLHLTTHVTTEASRYSSTLVESKYGDLAITFDGVVWLADYGKGQLFFYDPEIRRLDYFQGSSNVINDNSTAAQRFISYLYVDRKGNLWVDDRGWLDFSNSINPVWHKVIRSTVFISDSASPENKYVWSRPNQMFQSLDGSYWFSDYNVGIVNLDPNTGVWCKFTTGYSPITEDNLGNLWIVIYGKLYKLSS
jgi:streptogramin lyase